MITVLDASAAVEVVLQRGKADLLREYLSEADLVIAPTLFISEVTNVFWKYRRLTDLSLQACERGLEQAVALPDDFIDEQDFFREAFKLSCTLDHSVYDIMYLVAARRNNAVLLTLDKKLIRNAKECSIEVAKL
jgi:predicted nucleic acid-binding protein